MSRSVSLALSVVFLVCLTAGTIAEAKSISGSSNVDAMVSQGRDRMYAFSDDP